MSSKLVHLVDCALKIVAHIVVCQFRSVLAASNQYITASAQ